MKRPNLFVLGAPKCGTTVLAKWLSLTPAVFVSRAKEPHWFSEEHRLTPSLSAYEALFAEAGDAHRWVAEASVWYLFSPTAVPAIEAYSPGARYVVMVREPAAMVASMHEQHRFNGNELVDSLDEAVALSDARAQGQGVGIRDGYRPTAHLAYLHSCALGWQVEQLLQRVPRERVHVVEFADLQRDPGGEYARLLAFLGLDAAPLPFSGRVNEAKERRYPWLDRWVLRAATLKERLGIRARLHLLSGLRRHNKRFRPRAELDDALAARLRDAFRDDTARLSSLLRIDLPARWYGGAPAPPAARDAEGERR